MKKSVLNTPEKQKEFDKQIKEQEKEEKKIKQRLEENKKNRIKITKISSQNINNIDKLKENIRFIIIEKNKLLNEKNEINFSTKQIDFKGISDNTNFPYWNPFIVSELKNLNNESFKRFIDKYRENIMKERKN